MDGYNENVFKQNKKFDTSVLIILFLFQITDIHKHTRARDGFL